MEYISHRSIGMRRDPSVSERWLHEQLLADPTLLGLGEVDVIDELRRRGSRYPDSTIRTHIVSAMCINAPANHAVRYPDLHPVDRGRYVLAESETPR